MITAGQLNAHLRTNAFGRVFHWFDELDSTNDAAKSLAAAGAPEGTIVAAGSQRSGRGRQRRPWHSAPGLNLTVSVILRPPLPASGLGIVPLHAAVAAASCVRRFAGREAGCKWPNDVLVGGRKIAGILCESAITGGVPESVIVGIGLNVNERDFPPALASTAVSLAQISGSSFDTAEVLAELLLRLEEHYRPSDPAWPAAVAERWTRLASDMIGSRVRVVSGANGDGSTPGAAAPGGGREARGGFAGIARSVSASGALRLETGGRIVEITAGDVHLA